MQTVYIIPALAFPSQVLRYGLRTTRGNTGGVKVDAAESVKKMANIGASAADCVSIIAAMNDR